MILGEKDSQRAIEIACNIVGFDFDLQGSMVLIKYKDKDGRSDQLLYEYDKTQDKFVAIDYKTNTERKEDRIYSKLLFRDFKTGTMKLLFNVDFRDELSKTCYNIYYEVCTKVSTFSEALRICKNELFEKAYEQAIASIEKQYNDLSSNQPFGKPKVLADQDLIDHPELPWFGDEPFSL